MSLLTLTILLESQPTKMGMYVKNLESYFTFHTCPLFIGWMFQCTCLHHVMGFLSNPILCIVPILVMSPKLGLWHVEKQLHTCHEPKVRVVHVEIQLHICHGFYVTTPTLYFHGNFNSSYSTFCTHLQPSNITHISNPKCSHIFTSFTNMENENTVA
jgi:hypothetical protein